MLSSFFMTGATQMQKQNFSLGTFWLEELSLPDEIWVLIGKVTVISGYLENSLRETPAYIRHGHYAPAHWDFDARPSWEKLRDEVKSAARNSDIAPLDEQFCMAAGTALKALKKRGQLAHAVVLNNGNGNLSLYSVNITKNVSHPNHTPIDKQNLSAILRELIDAFDWLEACKTGLSYARGKRGAPADHPQVRRAAEALKARGNVPHAST